MTASAHRCKDISGSVALRTVKKSIDRMYRRANHSGGLSQAQCLEFIPVIHILQQVRCLHEGMVWARRILQLKGCECR